MSGYLSVAAIEECLRWLAATYPGACHLETLPEPSVEGRGCYCLRIGAEKPERGGVLLLGGVHAREIVNPDLLVSWAFAVIDAYERKAGVRFGEQTYSATDIEQVVESHTTFVCPLVNPDGRAYAQSRAGDPFWRKNRNPNRGRRCAGVDINRNFDFLWPSGIDSSECSCSELFRGRAALSEPETRNVRSLLDRHPRIRYLADIHSYGPSILYPWGDDDDQSADRAQNFRNPAFDGMRGTVGDTVYREYIPAPDLDWYIATATRMQAAIQAVRGRRYAVKQASGLYPTSGTAGDYAYGRAAGDPSAGKVMAFTLETGRSFQPTYDEGLKVMVEVSAGLVEFCLACAAAANR